jgi:hypothetical protein
MQPSARLLAAMIALAALVAAGAAGAASHRHARSHQAAASYPMKADDFRALMDKRILGVLGAIDKKLDRRGVSAERKKAIHKIFDEASKDLRAEIARASADGTVTQAEADKVKALAAGLRSKVRERLRAEKDPNLRAKLAQEEAAHKERAARKEKAAQKAKADPKEKTTPKDAAAPVKAARADAALAKLGDTPKPPAKAAKRGPTKPAKDAPGQKRKRGAAAAAPDPESPGENL